MPSGCDLISGRKRRRHSLDSTTVRGHVSAAGAKGGLANKLLAVRGAGSPVKFIVSACPRHPARLPPHARRSGGLESARQLARKSYSFMSFYFCVLALECPQALSSSI